MKHLLGILALLGATALTAIGAVVEQLGTPGEVHIPTGMSPSEALAVASVIFAFGVSWRTIADHSGQLKKLWNWKEDVDKELKDQGEDIATLKARRR